MIRAVTCKGIFVLKSNQSLMNDVTGLQPAETMLLTKWTEDETKLGSWSRFRFWWWFQLEMLMLHKDSKIWCGTIFELKRNIHCAQRGMCLACASNPSSILSVVVFRIKCPWMICGNMITSLLICLTMIIYNSKCPYRYASNISWQREQLCALLFDGRM